VRVFAVIVFALALVACAGRSPLGPDYEYEEDLTLSMDGSARLTVNTSIAALNALRGMTLDTDAGARTDQLRDQVRAAYESPYTTVGRISTWTRHGRRFVGIHLSVPDIRELPKAAPFSWAKYDLRANGESVTFRQTLSKPPARIRFQNSRYLDGGASRPASRGNILTWEQRLHQRLEGKPIAYAEDTTPDVMEARMDRESILYRTLWLFGIAFAAALLVIGGLIWLTIRRGRDEPADPVGH